MSPEILQIQLMQREERVHKYVTDHIPDRLKLSIPADDVLQEIWTVCFRTCVDLREDVSEAFDRWVFTIARNKMTDAIRSARAQRRGGTGAAPYRDKTSFLTLAGRLTSRQRTPSSEESARESVRAVRRALSALPAKYKQVITLIHIEGRPQAEAAVIMKCTPTTTNSLLFRALRKLRREMGAAARYFSDHHDKTSSSLTLSGSHKGG